MAAAPRPLVGIWGNQMLPGARRRITLRAMHETLPALPAEIIRGTTYKYRRAYSDFSAAAGWSATLYLAGGTNASLAATASGDSFEFTLSAAFTAGLSTGTLTRAPYLWEERVTKATDIHPADFGSVWVLPDLATASGSSLESRTAKLLAAVQAAINIRLGVGAATPVDVIERYDVGDRSIFKMELERLMNLEAALTRQLRREADPGSWGPQMRMRFSGVGQER